MLNLRNQLRLYMKLNSVTIPELAKKIGVPKSTISDWLTGSAPRDLHKLKLTATYFEISLDHLLFGEGKIEKTEIKNYEDEINAGVFEVVLRKVKSK